MMPNNEDIKRYKLCGVKGCCPTVEVNKREGNVKITDDDGNQVKLTKEQLLEAAEKVRE
ncbi:MAG: hypothetical protein WC805_02105 [Patescibacteria group bacterium]|jgi:hypothetical protein